MSEEQNTDQGIEEFKNESSMTNDESEILNPKPETKNMETHAYHLHNAPGEKIWHYVYEFLMLFLAVFCGFLVENKREHMVEHEREKKYIASLIGDLKTDISNIEVYIQGRGAKIKMSDSLIHLLISGDYKNAGSETYLLFHRLIRGEIFIAANGTMQQLKNSGGLRLIQKQEVVDSIIAYDIILSRQQINDGLNQEFLEKCKELSGDIFKAGIFYQTYNLSSGELVLPPGNPKLLTNDPTIINKLATQIIFMRGSAIYTADLAAELKKSAARLIEYLTKEYH